MREYGINLTEDKIKYTNCDRLCDLFKFFVRLQDLLKRNESWSSVTSKITIRDGMQSPANVTPEQVQVLTKIGALLREYSLLRLRPHHVDLKSTFEVAFGPHNAEQGDVLIRFMNIPGRQWSDYRLMVCVRPVSNLHSFKPTVDPKPSRRERVVASLFRSRSRFLRPVVFTDSSNGHTYDEVPPRKGHLVRPAYCAVNPYFLKFRGGPPLTWEH